MLPFGLKIAWFILSATGFVACWIVLWAFGRAVNIKWGPVIYCLGNSIIQIAFCLGMIYKMDPFQMPQSFCNAQTILISTGAFLITGVGMAFAIATYMTVHKPKTWGDGERALKWRNIYVVPILGFTVVASIIHITLVLKLDSAQPSDNMYCDSTAPEWVRLLGYAGIPITMILPSIYLSIISLYRIFKTNQHLQRARSEGERFTALPRVSRRHEARTAQGSPSAASMYRETTSPVITIAAPGTPAKKYPFRRAAAVQVGARMQMDSGFPNNIDDTDSRLSLTFPTFANPDVERASLSVSKEQRSSTAVEADEDKEGTEAVGWDGQTSADEPMDSEQPDSLRWTEAKLASAEDVNASVTDGYVLNFADPYSSMFPKPKTKRPIPLLAPEVYRIIMFQVAFISVQCLASISTIIDIAKRRKPEPFGTQHIALVLASWGPVFVFGCFPSVRRNLIPWRPIV